MRLPLAGQCPYYHCIWQVKNSIVLGENAYRKTNWAGYSPEMLNQTNYVSGLVLCLHLRQSFEDEVSIKSTLTWPIPDETASRRPKSLLPLYLASKKLYRAWGQGLLEGNISRLPSRNDKPNQPYFWSGTLSASKAKFWRWSFNKKYSYLTLTWWDCLSQANVPITIVSGK
jgi:hypothetical protein